MTTDANFVGGEDSTKSIDSTANSATQAANSTAEHQSDPFARELHESAQESLHRFVEEFFSLRGASTPVKLINDFLRDWLTTPGLDLQNEANREKLNETLALINFLTRLYGHSKNVQYFVDIKFGSN